MPGGPLSSTAFLIALLVLPRDFFPFSTEPWFTSHCSSQSRTCFTCHISHSIVFYFKLVSLSVVKINHTADHTVEETTPWQHCSFSLVGLQSERGYNGLVPYDIICGLWAMFVGPGISLCWLHCSLSIWNGSSIVSLLCPCPISICCCKFDLLYSWFCHQETKLVHELWF